MAGGLRGAGRRLRGVPTINRVTTGAAARMARLASGAARSLELHGIRAGDVRVELPNGRDLVLWSGDGDAWTSRFWWHGFDAYEPESLRPWFRLAQQAQTVLDVGSNVGIFALVAGLANSDADCYAFEPVPSSVEVLTRNVERNPSAKVTVVPAAVGASDGSVDIVWKPSQGHDLMARVDADGQGAGEGQVRESVPMVALDSWAQSRQISNVDLVKIDVEGHERDVLAGMPKILSRRPDLIIEILDEDTASAVRAVANEHGYNHYLLTPVGPIRTEQIAPHVCLNHLLTTRDDSAAAALW